MTNEQAVRYVKDQCECCGAVHITDMTSVSNDGKIWSSYTVCIFNTNSDIIAKGGVKRAEIAADMAVEAWKRYLLEVDA